MAPLVASPKVSRHTRRLLSAGIAAGPLFLVAWGFQAFTRDGFDPVVRIRIRGGRVVVDGGLLRAPPAICRTRGARLGSSLRRGRGDRPGSQRSSSQGLLAASVTSPPAPKARPPVASAANVASCPTRKCLS